MVSYVFYFYRALFREIPTGIKRTSSLKEERSVSFFFILLVTFQLLTNVGLLN